jgi:hypothetical protein
MAAMESITAPQERSMTAIPQAAISSSRAAN